MKAIILAAGYGNRLQRSLMELEKTDPELYEKIKPGVEHKQKALLRYQGRRVINHLVDKLEEVPGIDGMYVVTNDIFADDFRGWMMNNPTSQPLRIINNGNSTYGRGNGAVHDIIFAIQESGAGDDLLVCASDSIYLFDFAEAYRFFKEHGTSVVSYEEEASRMFKRGMALVDGVKLTGFVEKPKEPESTRAVLPFYMIRNEDIGNVLNYGSSQDNMGDLIAHLLSQGVPVFDFHIPKPEKEVRRDIGTIQDYLELIK